MVVDDLDHSTAYVGRTDSTVDLVTKEGSNGGKVFRALVAVLQVLRGNGM